MGESGSRVWLSRNVLAVLLIFSIVLSAFGAYLAVAGANPVSVQSGLDNGGHVGLVVVPSGQGHIGMVVAGNVEEEGMEE